MSLVITLDQQVRPHPDVVATELKDQETVLLHLKDKVYYSLNATGTRIWQGLKRNLPLRQISQELQAEFAVEPDKAERSVLDLVEELFQQHLVERVD